MNRTRKEREKKTIYVFISYNFVIRVPHHIYVLCIYTLVTLYIDIVYFYVMYVNSYKYCKSSCNLYAMYF